LAAVLARLFSSSIPRLRSIVTAPPERLCFYERQRWASLLADQKHILVVDGEGLIRETITAMLEDSGYRVSSAESGVSMRQFLKDDGIDAIVIDASMHDETSASLAAHAKSLRLPVVMISGNDAIMGYAAEHGLQLLHKPFRIHELCDALNEAFVSGKFGQRDT
jgi:DNA-binding NtrC family response regulator